MVLSSVSEWYGPAVSPAPIQNAACRAQSKGNMTHLSNMRHSLEISTELLFVKWRAVCEYNTRGKKERESKTDRLLGGKIGFVFFRALHLWFCRDFLFGYIQSFSKSNLNSLERSTSCETQTKKSKRAGVIVQNTTIKDSKCKSSSIILTTLKLCVDSFSTC